MYFENCKASVCTSTFPAAAAGGSTWMVPCTIPGGDALTVLQLYNFPGMKLEILVVFKACKEAQN